MSSAPSASGGAEPLPAQELAAAIASRVAVLTGAQYDELVHAWRREITRAILLGELRALLPDSLTQLDRAALYAPVASQIALVPHAVANAWLRARGVPVAIDTPAPRPRVELLPATEQAVERWPSGSDIVDALAPCLRDGFSPEQLRRMLSDAAKRPNLHACRSAIDGTYRWHPAQLLAWLNGRAFLRSAAAARAALAVAFPHFALQLGKLGAGSPDVSRRVEFVGPQWCAVPAQREPDCG